MNFKILYIALLAVCFYAQRCWGQTVNWKNRTVIQLINKDQNLKNKPEMLWEELSHIRRKPDWTSSIPQIIGDTLKWVINSKEAFLINASKLVGADFQNLFEPGDSVNISLVNKRLMFSGSGSEKIKVFYAIDKELGGLKAPSRLLNRNESVENYMAWKDYIVQRIRGAERVLELHKNKISGFAFEKIKARVVSTILYDLMIKFQLLLDQRTRIGLTTDQLCTIFDATLNKPEDKWLLTIQGIQTQIHYLTFLEKLLILRAGNFRESRLENTAANCKLLYDKAAQLFSGRILEDVRLYIITNGIEGLSMNADFEALLKEYYTAIKDPELKTYAANYESKLLRNKLLSGETAPAFTLPDISGRPYSLSADKGKTILLYFWESGDENCKQTAEIIQKLMYSYNESGHFSIVAVCLDKNKGQWQQAVNQKNGTMKEAKQLYTNGLGKMHPVVKGYQVDALPAVFIINANGAVAPKLSNPLLDKGKELNKILNTHLAESSDGPYVFHEIDKIASYSLNAKGIQLKEFNAKSEIKLFAKTDSAEVDFSIQLKHGLSIEPAVCKRPEKLFIVSDIEGEFQAFRKLLQANKIIDNDFKWAFGKGHLVFAGDMFDRGNQVTECLWLVYTLEAQAKASGGYIHFVLGNHDIMNMQGDHRYVDTKYKSSAVLMGKTLTQLYNENSELGRWLRTKNIVEKIGDLLFTHGGISTEISELKLPVEEINKLARPHYAYRANDYKNKATNTIMSNTYGPFWFRGYYNKPISESSLDSIMDNFKVKHIITGHTIIADTISVLYNGKVINTDTKHRSGKSEALVIEGANFYRVNAEGRRTLLFRDEKK